MEIQATIIYYPFCSLWICSDGGKITIPGSEITKLVLDDPNVNATSVCSEVTQKDTETLFIDPISKAGYIIQKVKRENNDTNVTIFKVGMKIIL